MNNIPKPWQIEYYKKTYPPGTRIELTDNMVGENIPAGTQGTVKAVDDIGSVHTSWDSGGSLAVIPGVDSFRKIADSPELPHKQEKKKKHGRDR